MTLFAQQEGKGSRRHVIGGLLGRFFEKNRERQGGGSKEGTGSGPQPNSFRGLQDNGSWVLTSDRLPSLPCPVLFLGWQEELEPYCHSEKKTQNWSSVPEPPFRCMDEAVSLFSKRRTLKALSSKRSKQRHTGALVRVIFVTVTKSDPTLPPHHSGCAVLPRPRSTVHWKTMSQLYK